MRKKLILSYIEFSRAMGVNKGIVTMNVKRGNIEADEVNKTIDPAIPKNKIWIEKQAANGHEWNLNNVFGGKDKTEKVKKEKGESKQEGKDKEDKEEKKEEGYLDEYTNRMRELEYQRKLQDKKRRDQEIKLKDIEIEKKNGQLVPVDATQKIFVYSIETLRKSYEQGIKAIINIYAARFEIADDQQIQIDKDIHDLINELMVQSKKDLISGLDTVISEYSEVRGRGERK